jgi:hypothetical protein
MKTKILMPLSKILSEKLFCFYKRVNNIKILIFDSHYLVLERRSPCDKVEKLHLNFESNRKVKVENE